MSHNRNTGSQDSVDRLHDLFSSFQFDGIRSRFLHNANRGTQSLLGIALVGPEGEIHHHQGPFDRPDHRGGMVDHLIERDRQGGGMAGHDIGSRVSDEDHVDARILQDSGKGEIIGGQHGNFLPFQLHLLKHMGGDLLNIAK